MAPSLKYPPNEKLPNISKKVWWVSSPTPSISEVRKDFCIDAVFNEPKSRIASALPTKYGLNCCIPAVVKSTDGSSVIKLDEGTIACPFFLKKSKNLLRISEAFILINTFKI